MSDMIQGLSINLRRRANNPNICDYEVRENNIPIFQGTAKDLNSACELSHKMINSHSDYIRPPTLQ